jgi:hypothetical protein
MNGLLAIHGVKLVIADDHKGLGAAARRVFDAGIQKCRVHWTRNMPAHAAPEQRAAVAAVIRTIFAQDQAPPGPRRAQIASTNPLERLDKEIERRADVVGIFPNDAAIVRLVGALVLEQSDESAVSHRYFSPENLAEVTDNRPRQPAAATGRPTLGPHRGPASLHHSSGHGPSKEADGQADAEADRPGQRREIRGPRSRRPRVCAAKGAHEVLHPQHRFPMRRGDRQHGQHRLESRPMAMVAESNYVYLMEKQRRTALKPAEIARNRPISPPEGTQSTKPTI